MEINKMPDNWYRIKTTNIFRRLLGLEPIEKRFKHLEGNGFVHAPNRGVYMTTCGKILSPFYDKKVDILDNYRRKLDYQ